MLTKLLCKDIPNWESRIGLPTDVPMVIPGNMYHLLSVEFFNGKFYYSLVEFGDKSGFEADLFEWIDETPHWRQWQEKLILN